MATTYKTLTSGDRVVTSNYLYTDVSVPSSSFSSSGNQYSTSSNQTHFVSLTGSDGNVMFDVTVGRSADTTGADATILAKEKAIYKQMAQTLLGFDSTGSVKKFSLDVDTDDTNNILHNAYFLNLSRLKMKDEIKKETFKLNISSSTVGADFWLVDKSGSASVTASQGPTGEYAVLYVSSTVATGLDTFTTINRPQGLVFYQAGIAVISPYIFARSGSGAIPSSSNNTFLQNQKGILSIAAPNISSSDDVGELFCSASKDLKNAAFGLYSNIKEINFQSTTELNSTVYFCRAFNNEFNYSSNPTYLSGSQVYVKNGDPLAEPISYITTVGLYDDQNQLMAVAKLSEPLKKTPSTEFIARVRLDF